MRIFNCSILGYSFLTVCKRLNRVNERFTWNCEQKLLSGKNAGENW